MNDTSKEAVENLILFHGLEDGLGDVADTLRAFQAELDKAKAEIERKDAAFQEIIDREDASWMPMRAFRSESDVVLDDARHEAWVEAADTARQALKGGSK